MQQRGKTICVFIYLLFLRERDYLSFFFLGLARDTGLICFVPNAVDVTAHVVNDSSILLSWDTTRKPPNITYCDMSRQFQVQTLTYDSYEKVERRLPALASEYQRTEARRMTEFLVPSLDRTKYYQFRIQNRYNLLVNEERTIESNTATTPVFFFGMQGTPNQNVLLPVNWILLQKVNLKLLLRNFREILQLRICKWPPPICNPLYIILYLIKVPSHLMIVQILFLQKMLLLLFP